MLEELSFWIVTLPERPLLLDLSSTTLPVPLTMGVGLGEVAGLPKEKRIFLALSVVDVIFPPSPESIYPGTGKKAWADNTPLIVAPGCVLLSTMADPDPLAFEF